MLLAALFTLAKSHMSMNIPNTMEHYSALRREEILMCYNFEDIINVKQVSHRINIARFHLCEVPKAVKFIKTESRVGGQRLLRIVEKGMRSCLMGPEFQSE